MVILFPLQTGRFGHSCQLWEFRATKLFLEKRIEKICWISKSSQRPHTKSISGWASNLTWTYCPYPFPNFYRSKKKVRNLASIIDHGRLYEALVSKRNNVTEIQKKWVGIERMVSVPLEIRQRPRSICQLRKMRATHLPSHWPIICWCIVGP